MRITDKHLKHLIDHGYAVVPRFLTKTELKSALKEFCGYFPTARQLKANPKKYVELMEEPEHLQIEFPFQGEVLNDISTHAHIIDFVERALGSTNILLSQSAIWAKYAGTGDFDQGLHLDYRGNTLVVPRDEGKFRQVNMILYYSDVTDDMGPTCVVPLEHTRNFAPWPPFRPKAKFPELYKLEKRILAKAGDLFVFGMGTFHRASAIMAKSGARFSHHLVYRSAECPFNGYHQWSQFGEDPDLERLIARATPRQREVLGFPRPGDPYWNEATLAGVGLRYPTMDLKPYRRNWQSRLKL